MMQSPIKGILLLVVAVSLSSCSTMSTRAYTEDKTKPDQVMEGNAGYLFGTPQPQDRSKIRPTRKFYYWEVTKQPKDETGAVEDLNLPSATINVPEEAYKEPVKAEAQREVQRQPQLVLPSFEEDSDPRPARSAAAVEVSEHSGPVTYQDYTVQKDDTMQKISHKFYGKYSKWTRIYEANKDKIKDPNRIKPGLTLQIPVEASN